MVGDASELISETRNYILIFRELVAAELGKLSKSLSQESIKKLVKIAQERFPNYPTVAAIPNLIELNVIAIAEELTLDQP